MAFWEDHVEFDTKMDNSREYPEKKYGFKSNTSKLHVFLPRMPDNALGKIVFMNIQPWQNLKANLYCSSN
jgi:hypothetical protein